MFLCRENELRKLNKRYNGDKLECIIIYGRRRIGKTALINEFVKDKPVIYFPALKSNSQNNLAALSKAIYQYSRPEAVEAPVFQSFSAAFAEITRIVKENRTVFVIDELPYLVESDDSILSQLQHLLDHDWADSKMYLILCGSSMSFMEKEVLADKSPIFGRRTAQFKIEPLTYLETSKFHPELNSEQNALIYGITGGVPHYINKLDVHGDIKEALKDNLFDTASYLFEEPENLLKQELREPAVYNAIISAIASGETRLNNIASKTNMESGACAKYIKTLIDLGIVSKIQPIIHESNRKTIYRITDPFFRFWYRFVPENMAAISSGNIDRVFETSIWSYISGYMGYTFENMCIDYLLKYAEDLPISIQKIGEWWGGHPVLKKEVQLDIVAISAKKNNISGGNQFLIGSCKYTSEPIGIEELKLIKDYASVFTDGKDDCFYYIFSKAGFTDALMKASAYGEVTLLSMEDIYNSIKP